MKNFSDYRDIRFPCEGLKPKEVWVCNLAVTTGESGFRAALAPFISHYRDIRLP